MALIVRTTEVDEDGDVVRETVDVIRDHGAWEIQRDYEIIGTTWAKRKDPKYFEDEEI